MILLNGWRMILLIFYKEIKSIIRSYPLPFWILITLSIALIALVAIPWYSYTIDLNGKEEIFIRTKKWYIFVIPGILTLFMIWYYTKYSYNIQITINIIIIVLYLYGIINPEYHVQIQGSYKTQLVYYIYFIILLLHTIIIKVLKQKENYIISQIIILWKMKTKQNI